MTIAKECVFVRSWQCSDDMQFEQIISDMLKDGYIFHSFEMIKSDQSTPWIAVCLLLPWGRES